MRLLVGLHSAPHRVSIYAAGGEWWKVLGAGFRRGVAGFARR